jgi:hypothetical protein
VSSGGGVEDGVRSKLDVRSPAVSPADDFDRAATDRRDQRAWYRRKLLAVIGPVAVGVGKVGIGAVHVCYVVVEQTVRVRSRSPGGVAPATAGSNSVPARGRRLQRIGPQCATEWSLGGVRQIG